MISHIYLPFIQGFHPKKIKKIRKIDTMNKENIIPSVPNNQFQNDCNTTCSSTTVLKAANRSTSP